MNNNNVGVIGLGAMGLGIARSLLRSGFKVHACDVRAAVTEQFAAEGGVACASAAQLAEQCEVIITVVVNAEQTESVLFGEGGAVALDHPARRGGEQRSDRDQQQQRREALEVLSLLAGHGALIG